jgi:hypothetical protein
VSAEAECGVAGEDMILRSSKMLMKINYRKNVLKKT